MPRHASTHAAGVVITRRPVYEYVPLAKNDEAVVCQYVMTTLEELGLLKMDFLGLREEENVRVLPARLCVCTTVAQREEIGIMAKEAIEPLLIFIQQTGLCVAGDALFRCISFESNENSSGKIYYHVMLPVEVGKTPK